MYDSELDSPPQPPRCPEPQECCDSGCDPCVFDLYNEELALYRANLAQWERRQREAGQQAGTDK
ncbi:oxidoreductase-like domain-containing protein [Chitinimonas lacunae]|uniref:Oxidoreductase-like domain-containing protein n=1 Tax=Chitinimonas lacunae TaxID=1963018 RepID=A0ABV8MMK9_9NEIS